ncbi:zinc finger (CCCH type) motif-containing protein [Besnoitia besnoiti]|uniref:Zinc finger (CCCH type) motif-containing protein n=1 Tax=Besnoitia besnoiti TaxID=94643 RepID=A0A2A9MHV5_BESBE|nr:zinc finger (CCCH type) motif-containing protein [Besnoitia besnoiti]PFH36774.1 zinc finger (CCCH type) motif-containing protein [Besnoitia besnoiti]
MALPPTLDDENLYKFRTKICERYVKQGRCEFADKCQYSHDLRWTRRPPWKYNYCPELCHDLQFVKDGRGRTIAKSTCKQKRNCKFAHTKEEQVYHPKMYKTIMCNQFQNNAWCDRYYCPFAHTLSELRPADLFDKPSKVFGTYEDQDALCPDIYLPSDKPHPRLRARFLSIMDSVGPGNSHHSASNAESLGNSNRTRHPYTDFISSHTPQSVLSESNSPSKGVRGDEGTPRSRQAVPQVAKNQARAEKQDLQSLKHSGKNFSTPGQAIKRHEDRVQGHVDPSISHDCEISGSARKHGEPLLGSPPLKNTSHRVGPRDGNGLGLVQNGGSILGNPARQISQRSSQGTTGGGMQLPLSPRAYAGKQSGPAAQLNSAATEREDQTGGGCHSLLHAEKFPILPTSPLSTISDVTRSPTAATPYVISSVLHPHGVIGGSQTSVPQQRSQDGQKPCSAAENKLGIPPGFVPQTTIPGKDSYRPVVVPPARGVTQSGGKPMDHDGQNFRHEKMPPGNAQSMLSCLDRISARDEVSPQSGSGNGAPRQHASPGPITNSKTPEFFLSSKHGQSGALKQLAEDIFYWSEPIGQSRDDPSVLVYAGVLLGPNNQARETVAIKQVPVVVTNRVRDSFLELEQFVHVNDPLIVNTKRVYCVQNDDDEGMSMMLVMEKCEGCLSDMIALSDLGERCLQEPLPPQGMTEMLSHLLSGVLKIQQHGHSAHTRIHPGNIMLTENFELKVGDCAGKIRYLSIFDLLQAGVQGAKNARELVHWRTLAWYFVAFRPSLILNSPQEAAWLAPELIRSLIHMAQQISILIDQYEALPPDGRDGACFVMLANNMKWSPRFLQRADAWSTGATLFYIVSGGLHPYGDISDRSIITHILEDRKIHLERIRESPLLYDLIEGLLEANPEKRTSLSQALCHAAFWKMGETEHFLKEFQTAVEMNPESYMVLALSDPISWISSLASAASPLFSLLVSYLTSPSCLSLLISSLRVENSVSFLLFLALLSADARLPVQERRALVSSAILLHPSAFLKAVRLLLFPRIPQNPSDFVISRNSTYVKQYLGDRSTAPQQDRIRAPACCILPGTSPSQPVPEELKHAIRKQVPQSHTGLLGAPPQTSSCPSPPVPVTSYPAMLPALLAPLTFTEGSCGYSKGPVSSLPQAVECQRPPPPPPVPSHVLSNPLLQYAATSRCTGLTAPSSRPNNRLCDFPPDVHAAGEPPTQTCVSSKRLLPPMIPQVQALMRAARAMRPDDLARAQMRQTGDMAAAAPVKPSVEQCPPQRMETLDVCDRGVSDPFAVRAEGISCSVRRGTGPMVVNEQATDVQSPRGEPASFQRYRIRETISDSAIAGLDWRPTALRSRGQEGHEPALTEGNRIHHVLPEGTHNGKNRVWSTDASQGKMNLILTCPASLYQNCENQQAAQVKPVAGSVQAAGPAEHLTSTSEQLNEGECHERMTAWDRANSESHHDFQHILKNTAGSDTHPQEAFSCRLKRFDEVSSNEELQRTPEMEAPQMGLSSDSHLPKGDATAVALSSSPDGSSPSPNPCMVQ